MSSMRKDLKKKKRMKKQNEVVCLYCGRVFTQVGAFREKLFCNSLHEGRYLDFINLKNGKQKNIFRERNESIKCKVRMG